MAFVALEEVVKEKTLNVRNCERCGNERAVTLPYGPHNFCKNHFIHFFEKRVKKTIRAFNLIEKNELVVAGLSGGKDSAALVSILAEVIPRKENLIAVSIDEGIEGYRDLAVDEAKKLCKSLGIRHEILSYKERFGTTMVEVVQEIEKQKLKNKSCSFCGVFRRRLLNDAAQELNADKLATGHNLDDELQSILMNFFSNNLSRLSRLGPITGTKKVKGLIPRIKPLYTTPEKDVLTYCFLKEIPHYSEQCCPFSYQAKRNIFRETINKMEDELPGSKYSALNSFLELRQALKGFEQKGEMLECIKCGAITSNEVCKSCLFLEQLKVKPENKKIEFSGPDRIRTGDPRHVKAMP